MAPGKYENQIKIGGGGMALVYRAWDPRIKRPVAIKQIHPHLFENPDFAKRFLQEPCVMARLSHTHIVTLFDVEETSQSGIQLIMEFCPGGNLESRLREQAQLPVREVVRLTAQLASALSHAHSEGIIHRDIKPANVLFDKNGNVKLTDFGIAAVMREARVTKPQEVIGTVAYMSPEQANGLELDGRSDLFSLGIVMYEMLTGETPYGQSSDTAIYKRLMQDREELYLQFPDHVPAIVQEIVRHLLRRHREDRVSGAALLAHQLEDILPTLPQVSAPLMQESQSKTIAISTLPDYPGQEGADDSQTDGTAFPEGSREGVGLKSPINTQTDSKADETKIVRPRRDEHKQPVETPKSRSPDLIEYWTTYKPFIIGILVVVVAALVLWILNRSDASRKVTEEDKLLHPLESTLSDSEQRIHTLVAQLTKDSKTPHCQSLKSDLTSVWSTYVDVLAKVNGRRSELKLEFRSSITKPEQLTMECLVPDASVSEAQLHSVVNTFQQAYERADKVSLREIARMSAERERNVDMMFEKYQAFTLTRSSPTFDQQGTATILLTITRAVLRTGSSEEVPELAKNIRIRVPRIGGNWDRIVWE